MTRDDVAAALRKTIDELGAIDLSLDNPSSAVSCCDFDTVANILFLHLTEPTNDDSR